MAFLDLSTLDMGVEHPTSKAIQARRETIFVMAIKSSEVIQ
jgi:hypothetical protein